MWTEDTRRLGIIGFCKESRDDDFDIKRYELQMVSTSGPDQKPDIQL